MTFEDVIKKEGKLIYNCVGVSMLPFIKEGTDFVIIEEIKSINKYDAVLFKRKHIHGRGEYALHRVIKQIDDDTYYIRGDNKIRGENIKKEDIIGILTGIKRNNVLIDVNSENYKNKIKSWEIIYPFRVLYMGLRLVYRKICNIKV